MFDFTTCRLSMNTTPAPVHPSNATARLRTGLALYAAALWWGSLTAVGFMVVPQLFANLETPAIAGRMAAKLFSTQTWVSCACALVLLMAIRARLSQDTDEDAASAGETLPSAAIFWPVAGMLFALLAEFAIAPRIVARENLALWHSLGSAMYLAQWGCAGVSLWGVTRQA
jgi:Domain of unknown function (DUF4149)